MLTRPSKVFAAPLAPYLAVIFARVGVTIPSTGEKLFRTPLRGVMSEAGG